MNLDCLLKSIDFFGINFDFRMKNYEKYKTKTGGIFFIFYFLSSTVYTLFVINSFFTNPSYIRDDFDKHTNNSDTEKNNNFFNFALRIPDFNNISIRDFLQYKVKYRNRDTSRLTSQKNAKEVSSNVSTKLCDDSLLNKYNNGKINISSSEIICFDLNNTHKIIGNQFSNHSYIDINVYVNKTKYCEYQKSIINILKKDTFYINLLFPHNIMQDDFMTNIQSLDGIFFYIDEKNKIIADFYLKQDIYRLDNNFLYSDSNDKSLMSYYYHFSDSVMDDTYYRASNMKTENNNYNFNCESIDEDPKILKIYIRNYVSYSVHVKTRVKLNSLLDKIISIYLNFFVSFKILLSLINMRKAKINILRNLFQVDFGYIEREKKLSDNEHLKATKDFLNNFIKNLKSDKSSFSEISNKEKYFQKIDNSYKRASNFCNEKKSCNILNPKNFNNYKIKTKSRKFSDFSNVINDKHSDCSIIPLQNPNKNEDKNSNHSPINEDKNIDSPILRKIENWNIDNPYKNENKQKIKLTIKQENKEEIEPEEKSYSFLFLLKKLLLCNFKKLNIINNYFNETEKLFNEYFNISNYIMKLNEIECLKNLILSENQKCLFYFLSYPCLQSPFTQNEILTKFTSSFSWNQKEKFDKNILAEKYKMVFLEKEEKNISKNLRIMFENKLK